MGIEITMAGILGGIAVILFIFSQILPLNKTSHPKKTDGDAANVITSTWLPNPQNNLAKYQFEVYALIYTAIWIAAFGVVVICQLYEQFDENSYMKLCVGLSLPFLLQPFVWPMPAEKNLPLTQRYSFKANVWIAIFSFIGNYWYTHYFYSVLQAKYTFPAHRLNDVPIALYFATHFYFVTYHTFSNLLLRKVETHYSPNAMRFVYYCLVILAFSYFTAFMETLTISSFPYYSFKDRDMAYKIGSAFYGIYFIVSFPVFYRMDENIKISTVGGRFPYTFYQVVMDSMGAGMIVLILLDLCRLALGIELHIPGKLYYIYKP